MDGQASNADDAKRGGEASPSASGKADGRFARPGELILQGEVARTLGRPRRQVADSSKRQRE
jgi:hypothetical protein